MGCTQSRSNAIPVTPPPAASAPSSAVPHPPPSTTSRPGPPRTGLPSRFSRNAAASSSSGHAPTAQWNDAPSAPLQRPKPWRSSSRTWTRSGLQRERIAFWDTRVQGRAECWAALRLTVDMCNGVGGGGGGGGGTSDASAARDSGLKEAHAIVAAAGLSCETGRLSDGVWDEAGHLYKLPRWVVSDPVNIVEDGGISAADADGEEQATEDDDDDDEGDAAAEEKEDGAVAADGAKKITLRARLSDRGKDAVIRIERNEKVRGVIRKVKAAGQLPDETVVRVAYMGKILKENEALAAQGWAEGHVVNALVFADLQR